MNKLDLLYISWTVIPNGSPLLEGIKGKLDCHNRVVYIVPVVYKARYVDLGNWSAVELLQLLQHFTAMLLFGFGSYCPVLGCIKCIEARNLTDRDLVGR